MYIFESCKFEWFLNIKPAYEVFQGSVFVFSSIWPFSLFVHVSARPFVNFQPQNYELNFLVVYVSVTRYQICFIFGSQYLLSITFDMKYLSFSVRPLLALYQSMYLYVVFMDRYSITSTLLTSRHFITCP